MFSIQFENEVYRSLLNEVLRYPPVLATFFSELYPTFLQMISRYQHYRPEVCKGYYTLLASVCTNAQSLTAACRTFQPTQLYLGARADCAVLTKHAQDHSLTVHVECADDLPLDQPSSQFDAAIVIIPSSFVSEVTSDSFLHSLLRLGAKSALLPLLLACCRDNLLASKRMVYTMKGLIAVVSNQAETLQFLCLLIEFLCKHDKTMKMELMKYMLKKPDPIWEHSALSPVQRLEVRLHWVNEV